LIYTVPGNFGAAEVNIVGFNKLAELKDPKIKATSSGHVITSVDDYIGPNQRFRIVSDPVEYEVETDADESLTGWVKEGTGDAVLSLDTETIIDGAGAIKATYTSALNDIFYKDVDVKGTVKGFRIYVRSRRDGSVLTFGAGVTAWSENTFAVPVSVRNSYQVYTFDASGLGLESIGQVGFKITDTNTNMASKTIRIDRIAVIVDDFRHFDLVSSRVQTDFTTSKIEQKVDWGDIPTKMESYISSLFAQAEEANFNSEIR